MKKLRLNKEGEPDMKKFRWVGVDLDGTLAEYHGYGDGSIGKPIASIVTLVQRLAYSGIQVKIFTSRVSHGSFFYRRREIRKIQDWCWDNVGMSFEVTCVKDSYMEALYDDRAFRVERNTGRVL